MIGFFPTPYPDELLYSACARYGRRADYPNKKRTIKELFGSKTFSASVDLPTRLEDFLSSFPPHNFTTDGFINRNTLLPFHEPFVSIERARQLRSEMKFAKENHMRMRLALNIPQVRFPEYLRFCPLCVAADRKDFGETYWHRIHQPAGISVCVEHGCFLQNSLISLERESSCIFHCADDSLNVEPPCFLSKNDPEHELFLYLAKNAEWLLTQENLCLEEGALRDRYHNLLLERGYAYYNGRIRSTALLEAFNEHFSLQTLETLGCNVVSAQTGWLSKMIKKSKSNVVQHPIRHLLLMNFLGLTAEEFFTSFTEYKPFGDPPYPCLNKGSDHYGELIIKNCEVFDNTVRKKRGKPLGIFACHCGFIYQRIGPDSSDKNQFTYSSIREYGKTWEDKLKDLWNDLNLSVSQIADFFQVNPMLIARHGIRLALPMNEPNTRIVQGYKRHRNPNKTFSDFLFQHRQTWLGIIDKYPTSKRQELMNLEGGVYLWLRRNDPHWLEEHLPEIETKPRNVELLNWEKIDNEISKKVEMVCKEILRAKRPVIRVSITEIIKRVGNKCWLEKREQKLPETTEIINRYLESLEDFMLRKILEIEKRFIEERKVPTKTGFIERARLKNATSRSSLQVQNSITAALERIKFVIESERTY